LQRFDIHPRPAFIADIGNHFIKPAHLADVATLGTGALHYAVFDELFCRSGHPYRGVLGSDSVYKIGKRLGNVIAVATDALL